MVDLNLVICVLLQSKILVLVTAVLAVGQARHAGQEVDGGGGGRKEHDDGKLTTEEDIEAAKRAKYYFSADVDDGISDLSQHRYEMRNGLDVKGYFSYSDGYQLRKVSYVADSDGYRIVRYNSILLSQVARQQSFSFGVITFLGEPYVDTR